MRKYPPAIAAPHPPSFNLGATCDFVFAKEESLKKII